MKRFLVLSLAGCCGWSTVEGTDWSIDWIFGSDWFDGTVDTDGLFDSDSLFSSFGLLSGIKFGLVTARKL